MLLSKRPQAECLTVFFCFAPVTDAAGISHTLPASGSPSLPSRRCDFARTLIVLPLFCCLYVHCVKPVSVYEHTFLIIIHYL
jgi:hypothetical protein